VIKKKTFIYSRVCTPREILRGGFYDTITSVKKLVVHYPEEEEDKKDYLFKRRKNA